MSPVNIVLKTVCNRFWISCEFQNHQKPLVFVGEIEDARFCAVISLRVAIRSILAPFYTPKSDQNRFWEGSEIDPKYDRKKCCVWDRSLDDFWTILVTNLGDQGGPTTQVFEVKSALGATLGPKIPASSLRDRIFIDFD